MPHYVNVASGKFFWRGFLLRAVAALVVFCKYIFSSLQISFAKNKVVQVYWLQKP